MRKYSFCIFMFALGIALFSPPVYAGTCEFPDAPSCLTSGDIT